MTDDQGQQMQTAYWQGMPSHDQGVMQIRLNTKEVRDKIEQHLCGKIKMYSANDAGEIVVQVIENGKQLVSDEGVAGIMAFVDAKINPQIVQGNYMDEEMFEYEVSRFRKDLAKVIVVNRPVWRINEADAGPIIDHIMHLVYPFLTRLLHNKERESYSMVKYVERWGDQLKQGVSKMLPW